MTLFGIPDQPVFGSNDRDNEDWEVVEVEETRHQHTDIVSNPTPSFTWHCEFTLQIGGQGQETRTGSSESENNDYQMAAVQCNSILEHQQEQCRLFNLPVEIRLQIYEQIFSIDLPKVQIKWYPANHDKNLQPTVLSILETCRRIHVEAEPIFYSINHLQYPINTPKPDASFFRTISQNRRDAIRSLTVSVSSGSEALSKIQEVTLLSKLQKLRIERRHSIRYVDIGTWVVLAKQLKTELEKLSELRELEIVTPEIEQPTPGEEQRMRRLNQIDATLQQIVSESKAL